MRKLSDGPAPAGWTETRGGLSRPRDATPEGLDQLVDLGSDFIKVINDPIRFSLKDMTATVEVANRRGLPVSVHTYADDGANLAIVAGVRNLEHPRLYSQRTIDRLVTAKMEVTTTFIAAFETVVNPVTAGADTLFEEADLALFRTGT